MVSLTSLVLMVTLVAVQLAMGQLSPRLVPVMGDFLPAGAPRSGSAGRARRRSGPTRSTPYGFRKLVDIAEQSIAQPFNDPTTTVQAIHQLHDCLRQLVPRPFPSGRHHNEDRRLRLIVKTITREGYADLVAVDQQPNGDGTRSSGSREKAPRAAH